LIDKDKSIVMGGKDYLLSKDFNNTANTGYAEINLKTCETAKLEKEEFPLSAKKQYEIYIMPDDKNLVPAFDAITKTLKNSVDNSAVAFIAIRPTPIPTNSTKQIVPRIVIVLKDIGSEIAISHAPTYNKQAADHILGIVYEALETIPGIKASGYWPRYSDKVIFGTIVGKQFMPKLDIPLVFIGQGNTDFKMANPKEFERKKLLGITRAGDMAYPLNTPESEKIRRETVSENAKR
jgi:hypothetical protein